VATISLRPLAVLPDRWYVVTVRPQRQADHVFVPAPGVLALTGGELGARFRPASSPRLRWIEVCQKDATVTAFLFEFSEVMDLDLPASRIAIAGSPAPVCNPTVPSAVAEAIGLYCTGINLTGPIVVTFPGLRAAQGPALVAPAEGYIFKLGELRAGQQGCGAFKPPLGL
jgi:hypothetical protein